MASPDNETASETKPGVEHTEQDRDLEHAATAATYIQKDDVGALTEEHRQYLIKRHGTIDLDPLPGHGDADPYNWPAWKVWALPSSSGPRSPGAMCAN